MFLSDVAPIRFDVLGRAVLSFVSLNYVELEHTESIMDPKFNASREAVAGVRDFVDDSPEYEEETRRGIVYLLNVDRVTFKQHLRTVKFPLPRWDPDAAHQILQEIWQAIWGDWHVPDFKELEFDLKSGTN